MDSRDNEQASVWPPDQIEEMNFPVARQLVLIERSKSPFEWLVVTLFWTGTGTGHWTDTVLAEDQGT